MGNLKDLGVLLGTELFQSITNNNAITIAKINAATALLIRADIPFDLQFSPGTRRVAAAANLTIFINPSTTLNFTISLEGGPTIFGGV